MTGKKLPIKIKLPEGFLSEEIRDGYKIEPQMKEVWAVLLDMLSELAACCSKNNIRWFVDGGTALGAVRHKGIIPWDDDIDVMMFREDYEKFCKVAPNFFKYPYFFQTEYTDPGCIRGHVQIRNSETTGILKSERKHNFKFNQGIFIDIFPVDDLPDPIDLKSNMKWINKISRYKWRAFQYRELRYSYKFKMTINLYMSLRLFIKHLLCKYSPSYYRSPYNKFESLLVKHKGTNSKYVAELCLPPLKQSYIWKREWFDDVIYLPFEFMQVPVPKGYEEFLNTAFGDWHKFVIGTSIHGEVIFDTYKSYKDYINSVDDKGED